jgi:hypothetical protein
MKIETLFFIPCFDSKYAFDQLCGIEYFFELKRLLVYSVSAIINLLVPLSF